MTANFALHRSDHLRFHRICDAHVVRCAGLAGWVITFKVLAWTFFGLATFAFVDLAKSSKGAVFQLMVFALCLLLGLLVSAGGNAFLRKRFLGGVVAADGWYLGQQTIGATDGGFVLTTGFGAVTLNWSGIRRVFKDDTNYYAFIEPGQGFVIPQAAAVAAALQPQFEARAEAAVK